MQDWQVSKKKRNLHFLSNPITLRLYCVVLSDSAVLDPEPQTKSHHRMHFTPGHIACDRMVVNRSERIRTDISEERGGEERRGEEKGR